MTPWTEDEAKAFLVACGWWESWTEYDERGLPKEDGPRGWQRILFARVHLSLAEAMKVQMAHERTRLEFMRRFGDTLVHSG